MNKRDYDSTVARIAGNIMSAYECYDLTPAERQQAAEAVVAMARAIVAETKRTEPTGDPGAASSPETETGK